MIKTEYMWWNDEWYQLSQMGVKGCWSVQAILQGGDYSAETQYAIAVDNLSVPEATRANSEFKATLEVRNAGVRMLSAVDIIANIAGKEKTSHPTQKSEKLMSDIIKIHTEKNDVILDPFMGSGSTGVAALLNERKFIGIELDENYYSISQDRLEKIPKSSY